MKKGICFTLLLLLVFVFAIGQKPVIFGRINDRSGNPIEGATVHVLNTNRFTTSDRRGNFSFGNLTAGNYQLTVTAIGYSTVTKEATLGTDQELLLQIQMAASALQLDAVIVSSEKKEELLQRIPASISAFTSKQVLDFRLWDLHELSALVPGLYSANPGDGRNVVSIRGITSTSYDPAVTTYIDGVNQFTLDTYIPQLFDVERIEVLRGPQSTLYGRNAMGGVINVITKQPTNKVEGFAEVSLGNYDKRRYMAGIKFPIVRDKLFLGVAGLYERLDGYYTNQFNQRPFDKQSTTAGNYYLKYLPSNKWELLMNVKHFNNVNDGAFPLVMGTEQAFNDPYSLNQNAIGELVDYVFNGSISVNHFAKNFTLSSQTSYQSNYRYYETPVDGDFSPIDGITIVNNYGPKWNNVKVFTEELKIQSPAASASKLKWTGGIYFFSHHAPNKQATHFGEDAALVGAQSTNFSVINTTDAKNIGGALYGQANYQLNKKTGFILGLRYDRQRTTQRVLGEYQPDSMQSPIFETQPDTSTSVSFSAFSPKVGVTYRVSSNSDMYATYSKGYRTGGLTQLSLDPSQPPLYPYTPEYSDNFEVGIKNSLFNNKLRANIAIFYTTVSDVQVPTLIIPDAVTVTRNAGNLRSKGIELETMTIPFKGLEATYNIGYTHARYSDLKLSQNGNEVDFAGNRQVFTPDLTSMLAMQYSFAVNKTGSLKMVLRGEWLYIGEEYFDLANSIRQSPHHLLNARFGVNIKRVDVFFWARNLSDTRYISYAYDFGGIHLGEPKTYGVTVRGSL